MAFKSIFDKTFKYRNALTTDICQTFERARREQRLQKQPAPARRATSLHSVIHHATASLFGPSMLD